MMASRVLLVCACCVLCSSAAAAQARGPKTSDGEDIRRAFLSMVQRPPVPFQVEVRQISGVDPALEAEHVSFAADSQERVPALIVKARSASRRRPVVIVLHGTGGSKERMRERLDRLARVGYVAVAIDGRHHGERAGRNAALGDPYVDAILHAYRTRNGHPFLYDSVRDVMRLIDYLETRSDIDPARIGLMGFSKGGMETYLAAAIDRRIAAAIPIRAVQSFGWALDHGAWDSRAWTIRAAIDEAARQAGVSVTAAFVKQFYDAVAPGLYAQFDGPAMLPLIAPRALLVVNGDSDPRTPLAGVRLSAASAARQYERLGAADRFRLHVVENMGHEDPPDIDALTIDWFGRWLKPQAD